MSREGDSRTVTSLRRQTRRRSRVNVFLDEEYAFSLDELLAAGLSIGQALSQEEIVQLEGQDLERRAYEHAVRLLAQRPRSQAEIERRLRQRRYPPPAIAVAVARLAGQGLLDDAEFARFWVEDRTRHRPRSAWAMGQELRQKGVNEDDIAAALAGVDEEALAWAAVEPRLAGWHGLDNLYFRRKVMGYLNRRGFDYATADAVSRRAWALAEADRSCDEE